MDVCLRQDQETLIQWLVSLVFPLGIALVEYGPLSEFQKYLKSFVLKSHEGGPITLSSLTGIPLLAAGMSFYHYNNYSCRFTSKEKSKSKCSYYR